MSIETYLESIETSRNTIRAKLVEMGMVGSAAKLDACAAVIADLINQGAVSVEIKEGKTYTIPAGYHNGAGVVKAVSDAAGDAEAYKTQAKTATPTKNQQTITPDDGYYALESVVIAAIPDNYQDVSGVTAGADDVLAGKIIVLADGTVKAGTMHNIGEVNRILNVSSPTYTIPRGYHDGNGKATINLEEKTVTPTKSAQAITPTSGKVLSKVAVEKIPDQYQDVSGVTTKAANVLDGDIFVDSTGAEVEGTMPNNGAVDASFDGLSVDSYTIPRGYHDGTGTVRLNDAIEKALAAI